MIHKSLLSGVLCVCSGLYSAKGQSLDRPAQNPARSAPRPASGDEFPAPPHRPGPLGVGPQSSGAADPEPEDGKVRENAYVSPYFDLTYRLPEGWREDFKGPPPSERGYYVLNSFRPKGELKGTVLIAAQDEFFGTNHGAMDLLKGEQRSLSLPSKVEKEPYEFRAGDHVFARFDFSSMGLYHVSIATEIRCHLVTFNIVGRDQHVIEELVQNMNRVSVPAESAAGGGKYPVCLANYATDSNLIHKVEPNEEGPKFVTTPVRIVIDTQGKVKHVHVIHAFPEQATNLEQALSQWVFKPYVKNGQPVEVETGLLFEFPSKHNPGGRRQRVNR